MNPQALTTIIERRMARFGRENGTCRVVEMPDGLSVSWCGMPLDRLAVKFWHPYWDANIIGDTFYLLSIQIPQEMRGRGEGARLYVAIEQVARDAGCREIRQTPSGWTGTGETRMSYLLRRGWERDGNEVFKSLRKPVFCHQELARESP